MKSRLKPVLLGLELAVAGCPGEGDDVADVGHAGDKHEQALEAQAKAGVGDAAVFPQIDVPVVGFGIEVAPGDPLPSPSPARLLSLARALRSLQ
jgi:hypothetical protein